MRVRFSARAERDLDEIIVYIASDKATAAQGVFNRIKAAARRLEAFPRLGRSIGHDEMRLGVARTPYSLVYRITPREVLILRIHHSAQKWELNTRALPPIPFSPIRPRFPGLRS